MQGNLLVPFLEGLEAAMPPGYSADGWKRARKDTSPAVYPTALPQEVTHMAPASKMLVVLRACKKKHVESEWVVQSP